MTKTSATGMTPETWREVSRLLDLLGDDAELEAATRADERLDAGDLDGAATWRRVLRALDNLRRAQPRPGDARA
jgi:hypothetical protein